MREVVGIVPKIRRIGGATIAGSARQVLPTVVEDGPEREHPGTGRPMTLVGEQGPEPATEEQGGASSPGNNSSASSVKPPTSSGPSETDLPKRARTTGNRSGRDRTVASTARTTGGSGTASTTN